MQVTHYFVKGTQAIKPAGVYTPYEVIVDIGFEVSSGRELLSDIKFGVAHRLGLTTCNESHVGKNVSLVSIDYISKL